MSPHRARIVAEARSWIGTPWVHQHQLKGVAVDCAQLIIGVARACGLVDGVSVQDYGRHPDGTIEKMCGAHLVPVDQKDMQPGDVLVVAVEHQPQHLGILADYRHGGLSVVHAANTAGKVIETRLIFARGFRFVSAYRFPGVD